MSERSRETEATPVKKPHVLMTRVNEDVSYEVTSLMTLLRIKFSPLKSSHTFLRNFFSS